MDEEDDVLWTECVQSTSDDACFTMYGKIDDDVNDMTMCLDIEFCFEVMWAAWRKYQ